MTVDAWFNFWIENIVGDLAPNTRRNYRERYKQNIQPVIGKLLLSNVKPLHCQKVLNDMNEDYAGARQTLAKVAQPNATTAYLLAVVDARQNSHDGVYANLKVAFQRDANLKAKAAQDIEFAKYQTEEAFQNLVK